MAKKSNRSPGVPVKKSYSGKSLPPSNADARSRSGVDAPAVETPAPAWSAREDERSFASESFWPWAFGILLVGIVLRQLWLANFPYHPDEAIHAWFSHGFASYRFDPIYHGPVLYHLVASTFGFFSAIFGWLQLDIMGANDYTARLVPSVLGIALLAYVLFGPLRDWMGPCAVLWSAALLAISPVVVTYSRRLLHDSLVLMLTLAAIIALQTARENRAWTPEGRRAWFLMALALALFVSTKANSFFIILMLGGFWGATLVRSWLPNDLRGRFDSLSASSAWRALPMLLFLIASVASYFALRDGFVERNERLLRACFVLCVGVMWCWLVASPSWAQPRAREGSEEEEGASQVLEGLPRTSAERRTASWRTGLLAAWSAVLVFAWFFGHGYLWWKVPVNAVTQFPTWSSSTSSSLVQIKDAALGRAELLPGAPDKGWTDTRLTIAQDWDDVTMAMPRLLAYWGKQQKEPRLPGRHDYYITLIALYELPIALAALGGIWWVCRHRTAWGDLLLWWAFTSWVLYALANEKVPWLLVHMVVPFALLGGWWLSQLALNTARRPLLMAASVAGAIFLLRNLSATNFERAAAHREPMFYAQTSEDFRDALGRALTESRRAPGYSSRSIWVHGDKQWPPAWYLIGDTPIKEGSGVGYGSLPEFANTRMVITTEEDWASRSQLPEWKSWQSVTVDHYIWPRASWPALRPDRFARWWTTRVATPPEEEKISMDLWQKSILTPPGEWSHNKAVFAWPGE
jgi:predicted membrane-bound mannosyltransferase